MLLNLLLMHVTRALLSSFLFLVYFSLPFNTCWKYYTLYSDWAFKHAHSSCIPRQFTLILTLWALLKEHSLAHSPILHFQVWSMCSFYLVPQHSIFSHCKALNTLLTYLHHPLTPSLTRKRILSCILFVPVPNTMLHPLHLLRKWMIGYPKTF